MSTPGTINFSVIIKLLPVILFSGAFCFSVFADSPGLGPGNEAELRELVEKYSNLEDCHIEEFHWFALGSDLKTELMVHYRVGDYTARFTDIFSFADPENPSRLFHGDGYVQALHCRYEETQYLFAYLREGSGGFLTGNLFSWDGVGPLAVEYRQDSGIQGWVAVSNGSLCFSEGTKYFRLEKTPAGFDLVEFQYEVSYPDLGSNVHILEAVQITPDSLAISINGNPLAFTLTQDDEHFRGYGSRDTLYIGLNEEILVIGGGCSYGTEDFQSRVIGLVASYAPLKEGDAFLSMRASHNVAYHLNFKVSGRILRR